MSIEVLAVVDNRLIFVSPTAWIWSVYDTRLRYEDGEDFILREYSEREQKVWKITFTLENNLYSRLMSWRWAERSGPITMRLSTTCLSRLCRCWTIAFVDFLIRRWIRCNSPVFARWTSCFYLLPEHCDYSLSPHLVELDQLTGWLAGWSRSSVRWLRTLWLKSHAHYSCTYSTHCLWSIGAWGSVLAIMANWPLKHCTLLINEKSCIKSCLGCDSVYFPSESVAPHGMWWPV